MKKLIIALSVLLILVSMSSVRAETSASAYGDGKYWEQQAFTEMRNNSGAAISSNRVVVLDCTIAVAGSSTLGSAFITTTMAGATGWPIIGVTDENISSGSIGRVCIRGPHLVEFVTNSPPTTGNVTVTTGTTAGYAALGVTTTNNYNILGTALKATATTETNYSPNIWWIWVRPTSQ